MPNRSPPKFIHVIFFTIVFTIIVIFFIFKLSFLIVLSGSMEPCISTGSILCICREFTQLNIGDIVTYDCQNVRTERRENVETNRHDLTVTHRICEIKEDSMEKNQSLYLTKGDANKDPDIAWITRDQIRGKVCFSIPYMGFILFWIMRNRVALVAVFLIVIILTQIIGRLFRERT